jgi:hypothetical protein
LNAIELSPEDMEFLCGSDPSRETLLAARRRASDRQLLQRRAAAEKAFQPVLQAALAQFRANNPGLCAGLTGSGRADFRPAPTEGQGAMLVRLLQVVLNPASASRTQEECREIVAAAFPNHAVYKNWTKPLPSWAVARAKSILAGSSPPVSSLKIKAGVTLKDLHNAVRAAVEGHEVEAKVIVTITTDAVVVNGHRFKRTVNRAKGKEYSIVRMAIPVLESALKAKSKSA